MVLVVTEKANLTFENIRDFAKVSKEVVNDFGKINKIITNYTPKTPAGSCPECGSSLIFEEGCKKCHICGFSACG